MVCVPRPAGDSRFAWGVILLLALPLAVYGQMGWRFWTAADGMAESYSQSVGIAPDGTAWGRPRGGRGLRGLEGEKNRWGGWPPDGASAGTGVHGGDPRGGGGGGEGRVGGGAPGPPPGAGAPGAGPTP